MASNRAKLRNTYKKGKLTFITYETAEKTYVSAVDELCLVVEEKDKELSKLKILANAKSYLHNVIENKLGEHLLNQTLPDEIKTEFIERAKSSAKYYEKDERKLKDVLNSPVSLANN